MPVMDGLQATRLIRSFEETGHWNDAVEAGIDPLDASSDVQNGQCCVPLVKRTPIIAVSILILIAPKDLILYQYMLNLNISC